jgi:hypothetical protein
MRREFNHNPSLLPPYDRPRYVEATLAYHQRASSPVHASLTEQLGCSTHPSLFRRFNIILFIFISSTIGKDRKQPQKTGLLPDSPLLEDQQLAQSGISTMRFV